MCFGNVNYPGSNSENKGYRFLCPSRGFEVQKKAVNIWEGQREGGAVFRGQDVKKCLRRGEGDVTSRRLLRTELIVSADMCCNRWANPCILAGHKMTEILHQVSIKIPRGLILLSH